MEERTRILIIDDNPDNIRVAMHHLEFHGFDVRVARDGETGLRRAAASKASLILLDVDMPGIDGFETCRQLKANPEVASIPVIFMTSHADVESKVAALTSGGVDYVTKPFAPMELLARVRTHLKIGELQQALAERNDELESLNDDLESRVAEQVQSLVERSKQVELLNLQLRAQVKERSEALERALHRLSKQGSTQDPGAGKLLGGRYRLGETIAQGGMGAVFHGVDEVTGERVAIKMIRSDMVRATVISRFLREARLAASVDHPAVVRMLEVNIQEEGLLYQVQEYVEGQPLQDFLGPSKARLLPGHAARLLSVLAGALSAAHAQSIVHRDLKPPNIMLTPAPPGLKLLDFGISKIATEPSPMDENVEGAETFAPISDELNADLTVVGFAVGTPRFMSPEQRVGLGVTMASDIYSFGVLAHLLLTGDLPFKANTPPMPPGFSEMVLPCLRFEPETRPLAGQVASGMEALADAASIPALHLLFPGTAT